MARLAAIDIGSNATRLLLKDSLHLRQRYSPTLLPTDYFKRYPLPLGQDVFSEGHISSEKEALLTDTLRHMALTMAAYGTRRYRACATASFRAASNGLEVTERLEACTGLHIEIITGQEEAWLSCQSYLAQQPPLASGSELLFCDVGGGSTDLCLFDASKPQTAGYSHSFNLGAMNWSPAEAALLTRELQQLHEHHPALHVIGTGGGIHHLCRLHGASESEIDGTALIQLSHQLNQLTTEERMAHFDLRRDRAEVIAQSARIFTLIVQATQAPVVRAPHIGVRDGVIVQLCRDEHAGHPFP